MATAAFQSIIPNLLPFRFPQALENLLSRALGIQEIARVYVALRSMGDQLPMADRLLDFLGLTFTTSDVDLARIPNIGPAIVTANHPFGILEGAILASLLRRIRPDVRFLANDVMGRDLPHRRCHIRAQAKPRCVPLLSKRLQSGPEESRARR